MKIGCFALVEPFSPMERQFQAISEMGIQYADLTDNHNGAMLGVEYGFTASISLDSHPKKIREMVEAAGITLTSVCAHANLLDPASPDTYGTNSITKAVRLASLLGIKHVHWKDMSSEWQEQRGKQYGCGMAVIPLGDGVIDIEAIVKAFKKSGFDGATTLEIAGPDNVIKSIERLNEWWNNGK